MKLRYTLNTVVLTIVGLFFILHLSPGIATRTVLFEHGYFHSALTAKLVRPDEYQHVTGKHAPSYYGITFYVVPSPVSEEENIDMNPHPNRIIVHTFGLSFAEMDGEG